MSADDPIEQIEQQYDEPNAGETAAAKPADADARIVPPLGEDGARALEICAAAAAKDIIEAATNQRARVQKLTEDLTAWSEHEYQEALAWADGYQQRTKILADQVRTVTAGHRELGLAMRQFRDRQV